MNTKYRKIVLLEDNIGNNLLPMTVKCIEDKDYGIIVFYIFLSDGREIELFLKVMLEFSLL